MLLQLQNCQLVFGVNFFAVSNQPWNCMLKSGLNFRLGLRNLPFVEWFIVYPALSPERTTFCRLVMAAKPCNALHTSVA